MNTKKPFAMVAIALGIAILLLGAGCSIEREAYPWKDETTGETGVIVSF